MGRCRPNGREQRDWFRTQQPVDLAIVSGFDGSSDVEAPVVVEVPVADGAPVGRVAGSEAETVRTLEELLALLPNGDGPAPTA